MFSVQLAVQRALIKQCWINSQILEAIVTEQGINAINGALQAAHE